MSVMRERNEASQGGYSEKPRLECVEGGRTLGYSIYYGNITVKF